MPGNLTWALALEFILKIGWLLRLFFTKAALNGKQRDEYGPINDMSLPFHWQ